MPRIPPVRHAAILPALILATCAAPVSAVPRNDVDFDRDIRPLLTEHCSECHGGVKQSGGFSVISRAELLGETDTGTVVVQPGNSADSELIRRVAASDAAERMPPEGHDPLSGKQIGLLRQWIDDGAKWPTHWAWAPVPTPTDHPPAGDPLQDSAVIDRLVADQLTPHGIEPSPPADPRVLVRRLHLDLLGLLPEPSAVDDYAADPSAEAFTQLVDRLLASEHYGERWARHWLDEARYADSEGYEKDTPKSDAWRYRDWVIRSINADMPFDEFTIRQIAGDLLPEPTTDDLIATKFHLQTQFNLEGGVDAEEDRTKRVIDRVNTVSTVWLGTSLGCCQCHHHPYDALTQRDFYGMYAFFNNADFTADILDADATDEEAQKKRAERQKKWNTLRDLLDRQVTDKNLATTVQSQLSRLRNWDNSNGFTRYLTQRSQDRRTTWVFHRGNFLNPDRESGPVRPSPPDRLPPLQPRGESPDRLDLAHWLVDPHNPLVARVTVNKVWMHLFGRPLVDQPQDFGARGGVPSHPRLLDWLAHWFVHEADWSRKELIRLIVHSRTWQRSSHVRPELRDVDPDNRLLARQNRFRVEAEIVRDIALQASGLLSRRVGGPSVYPPLPKIVSQQTYANSNRYKVSEGEDRYRRGLYTFFRRTAIDPNLTTFDCPDSSMTRAERDRSNNPLQALALLHNEVFHEAARHFARRILESGGDDDAERLTTAFRIALGREPAPSEREPLTDLLATARDWYGDHDEAAVQLIGNHAAADVSAGENAAWVATLRVILNLDEFVTRG